MGARRDDCCPVEATMGVIGGRWKAVILHHLLGGPQRFGELSRLVPRATQRMLTLQLRELEEDGVVHREVFRQIPPKVEYSLTDLGRSLEPNLAMMQCWGQRYMHEQAEHSAPAAAQIVPAQAQKKSMAA